MHDIKHQIQKTDRFIKDAEQMVQMTGVSGVAACCIGGVLLLGAVVCACKNTYDWTIFLGTMGAVSECLGASNVLANRDWKNKLADLNIQKQKLEILKHR